MEKCELITTCGEVTVPETHLDVCQCRSLRFSFLSLSCLSLFPFSHPQPVMNGKNLMDISTLTYESVPLNFVLPSSEKTRSLITFFLSSFPSNHSFKPCRYVDTVMPREGYVERLPELLELESMELILFSMSLQCKRKGVTKEQLLHTRLIVNRNQLWIGKQCGTLFSLSHRLSFFLSPFIFFLPISPVMCQLSCSLFLLFYATSFYQLT